MNRPSIILVPPVWGADLVTEPEQEHNWVVPNVMERGDRAIITGGEGEGKSTLLRQIALQVSLGIHPFTLEPIERQRVLLMDLENSREQIKEELTLIAGRAGVEIPGEPWLAIGNWPSGVNLPNPQDEAALKEVLATYRPDLLIGGPLYKMADLSLSDENASRSVVAALDRYRADFGFAFMVEAHQVNESTAFDPSSKEFVRNRPTRPFGSSLWRRWPEFGFCLFYDGRLHRWRGDRQSREWPARLQRDGDVWLWQSDTGLCPVCLTEKAEGKDRYCSDRCRETAKKRRQRAK